MKPEIVDVREVPMDALEIGPGQVRTSNVNKGVDDLAASINKMGMLEPIVVAPIGDGRFEILTGQRRFLAHQLLQRSTIRACILKEKPSENLATAISLTENMVRRDISTREYINACTDLFRKYGSIKAVSEELGLPSSRVSEYVKFDQLLPDLKSLVETNVIDMKTALRAQKAATNTEGDVAPDKAVIFAKEMKGMSGIQQKNVQIAAESKPDAPAEQILEIGRKQPKQKQIVVAVGEDLHAALQKFAADEGTTQDDAAASLIESGLTGKGYF